MCKDFQKSSSPQLALNGGLLGAGLLLAVLGGLTFVIPQRPARPSPAIPDHRRVPHWRQVEPLPRKVAVLETVFWEPADTDSLRAFLADGSRVRGKTVLEIGTGSGLLALCCLHAGAARVVATDVNPSAVANAAYNARRFGFQDRLEVRQVPADDAGAWTVIQAGERFDLVISNPPWENQRPRSIAEYALYDPDFVLLRSLIAGLRDHLKPGGRALLAYGCRDAIEKLHDLAEEHDLEVNILDERPLHTLPDVFLPGMLLEVTPRPASPR